ncbi:MAG: molybdopterin-dependent oxidoreductase, partial [Chloroflexota bacterium]
MAETGKWTWEEDGMTVVRSIARTAPGCHEGCGVRLYVKDGRLVKVEGDPDFPLTGGRLCPRCLALPEVIYHPDRLKYPLKRVGERGEGKWQRITWDEAYNIIVARFNAIKQEYGAEAVIFCRGTGRDIRPYLARLCFSYGSPNQVGFGPLDGHACYAPKIATMGAVLGGFAVADCAQAYPERYDHPEWRVPECIVIWGNNPLYASPDGFLGHWIIDCLRRGTELIVIDPRKTWLATRAKHWLQIRPGTDAALALGMLNIIIKERLYDREFVDKWTYGFDKLAERAAQYPVERMAEITWIPKEDILAAARMFARSKPASVQWGFAVDTTKESFSAGRAILSLFAITGNLDVPGGMITVFPPYGVDSWVGDWGYSEFVSEQAKA